MIETKDVITMKVPFPDINSNLATKAHMYLCIEKGMNKSFLSCQTKKPLLLIKSNPPFEYLEEAPDLSRNPFKHTTLISCDSAFCVNGITVDLKLLTSNRRDVCDDIFQKILCKISHPKFSETKIDENQLLKMNSKIKKII
ncbi:TPA_asm: hypothetical protein GD612_08460 [Listeria monocytogenes]|nr:hypothetical protein [Listeria monocytogenes]HAA1164968.1 hypothetical protein [Listeria monocytogenes]HAA1170806.1 hypothetical protein [Listeria monocytogenes]HAA1180958.1 hypothetical protein [Listeria monocytogenes]HAA1183276.1 hypothetical protein [Listeria monocytogenes]